MLGLPTLGRTVSVVLFVATLFLPLAHGFGDTYVVPDDYESIQEAIDVAEDGDTIEVTSGVYEENIDFLGKDLTLIAVDGPKNTVLTAEEDGSVVTFTNGETEDAILDGFTITGGTGNSIDDSVELPAGGGIFIEESSPTIINNIVEGNEVSGTVAVGAGIYIYDGTPVIRNNVIRDNEVSGLYTAGGGIALSWGEDEVVIEGNVITGNSSTVFGGGIATAIATNATISRNIVYDNTSATGAGMTIGGSATVVNNTIFGNTADENFGGISGGSNVTISNCIIWGNDAPEDPQITTVTTPVVTYTDIEDIPVEYEDGIGNIDDDPMFQDPDNGDLSLSAGSPCIDSGDPDLSDDDGTTSDIGAVAVFGRYFLRGDVNGNGNVSALTDALYLLQYGFTGGAEPACMDAADVDGNGVISFLIDSLYLLQWQFDDGPEPVDPGPSECGRDPLDDVDDIGCEGETC